MTVETKTAANSNDNLSTSSIEQVEAKISFLLRRGVIWAGVFLFWGWVWMLYKNGNQLDAYTTYQPMSLYESLQWAIFFGDKGKLISYAGLMILVSLPILRVAMTFYLFIKSKEKSLALLALIVLISLIWSICLGIEI